MFGMELRFDGCVGLYHAAALATSSAYHAADMDHIVVVHDSKRTTSTEVAEPVRR